MATSSTFSIMFLLMLSSISGGIITVANGQNTWCVAKPSTDEARLQYNIDYACTNAYCLNVIQPGSPCFLPATPINHASIVMNLYYKSSGGHIWNCNFTNSALIVTTDPSYDNCHYM